MQLFSFDIKTFLKSAGNRSRLPWKKENKVLSPLVCFSSCPLATQKLFCTAEGKYSPSWGEHNFPFLVFFSFFFFSSGCDLLVTEGVKLFHVTNTYLFTLKVGVHRSSCLRNPVRSCPGTSFQPQPHDIY